MSELEACVLTLVGEVSGLLEAEDFRHGLFAALQDAVPSDYISLNQVGSAPDDNWSIADAPLPDYHRNTYYRLALQNPLAERMMRTRDGRPLRLSDVTTSEAFHATDLYREFYGQVGIEHQIAFSLPSDDQHILAIALSRCVHDYTDYEREVLALARPHLIQAYRNVLQFSEQQAPSSDPEPPRHHALEALGLTPTQARVLRLIAMGRSTPDIAVEMQIATRTVHKHLQHVYRRLGVTDRSTAADRAWLTTSQAHTDREDRDS